MNESRQKILKFIKETCFNISLKNEYTEIGQKNEDGSEMTAMQVIAEKATVWREIGVYLEEDYLQLDKLYAIYCSDLASTLVSDEFISTESVTDFLNRCKEKETVKWTCPEYLKKANY